MDSGPVYDECIEADSDLVNLNDFDSFWLQNETCRQAVSTPCSALSREQEEVQVAGAGLLQLHQWDDAMDQPEGQLYYTIEWKAVLKTKRLGMDTEQYVVLTPGAFWEARLRQKIDNLLDRKFSPRDRPEPDDTVVVASVSKRAERDLSKEFLGLAIDWSILTDKLESWERHFRAGAHLTLKMIFRFRSKEATASKSRPELRQSASRRMRDAQALQQNAEEVATGAAACWRTVYSMMRCPGHPCPFGQYCWRDPHGGKHYKLMTHHLRELVHYMEAGNVFQGHEDVPESIRQQLYAEDHQRKGRHRVGRSSTPMGSVQQSIMPSPAASPASVSGSTPVARPTAVQISSALPSSTRRLEIPGSREAAVQDYVKWQQNQSSTDEYIAQYAKAGSIVLQRGYNLQQLFQRQNIGLLTGEGILEGIALSFFEDIPEWLLDYRSRLGAAIEHDAAVVE